jgi:hypothetical protein
VVAFIFLICVVGGGVASDARARGGNPWLWGAAAAFGFVLIPMLGGLIYRSPGNRFQGDGVLWSYFGAFFWMVIVAICARFRLGGRRSDS